MKLYSLTEHQLQLGLMLSTEVGRGVQIEQVSQGKKSKVPIYIYIYVSKSIKINMYTT